MLLCAINSIQHVANIKEQEQDRASATVSKPRQVSRKYVFHAPFSSFFGVENTIYIYRYEDKIKPVYIVHSFIEQYVFSIH